MATIVGKDGSSLLGIDPNLGAASVAVKPWDVGNYGAYRVVARSAVLTGTGVVANATLFSMRWTDPTKLLVLARFKASLFVRTIFASEQELAMYAKIVRGYTVDSSGGNAVTFANSGNDNEMKASMAPTSLGSMMIGNTSLLTDGTFLVDQNAFAYSNDSSDRIVNAAAATAYLPAALPVVLEFAPNIANGEWPVILGINEGIIVRNTIAWAATGACRLHVEVSWLEVAAWP